MGRTASFFQYIKKNGQIHPLDEIIWFINANNIPEFDGRITTCPSAFKETIKQNTLYSEITSYKADLVGIKWISKLATNYVKLQKLNNFDKNIV